LTSSLTTSYRSPDCIFLQFQRLFLLLAGLFAAQVAVELVQIAMGRARLTVEQTFTARDGGGLSYTLLSALFFLAYMLSKHRQVRLAAAAVARPPPPP
jgi:hypothetical protein